MSASPEQLAAQQAQQQHQLDDHARQLADHDSVISALVNHLGALIQRFDQFEKRLWIAGAIIFASTKNGAHIGSLIGSLFS